MDMSFLFHPLFISFALHFSNLSFQVDVDRVKTANEAVIAASTEQVIVMAPSSASLQAHRVSSEKGESQRLLTQEN